MKLATFTLTLLLMTSCVNSPNAVQTRYARDNLYCWYKDDMGRWTDHGLASECPEDAPLGGPTQEMLK